MCRVCIFHKDVCTLSLSLSLSPPFLFSPSLPISVRLSLSLPPLSPSPPSSSLGDHTQRFLFPVGVMSLLTKQSALICQRSSRRFMKIQQAPTKDVRVPPHSLPPLLAPRPKLLLLLSAPLDRCTKGVKIYGKLQRKEDVCAVATPA